MHAKIVADCQTKVKSLQTINLGGDSTMQKLTKAQDMCDLMHNKPITRMATNFLNFCQIENFLKILNKLPEHTLVGNFSVANSLASLVTQKIADAKAANKSFKEIIKEVLPLIKIVGPFYFHAPLELKKLLEFINNSHILVI